MNNNMLVPIDFTEKSIFTFEQACNFAKLLNLEINLLHVRQDTKKTFFFSLFSESETEDMKKKYLTKLHSKLEELAKKAEKKYKIKINVLLAKGKVADKVNELSETVNTDFIFLEKSTSVEGPSDYIGSDALRIIRETKYPVLILNGKDISKGFKNIILPLDLSSETRQKVNLTVGLAKRFGASIKVVSGQLSEEDYVTHKLQTQLKQVDKFIKVSGVECTSEIIKAHKKQTNLPSLILDYANSNNGDLIVIMTQQEVEWVEFFIGSNALEMIKKSNIPVLTVIPKQLNTIITSL